MALSCPNHDCMKKRLLALTLGLALAVSGTAVSIAKPGGSGGKSGTKRAYQFHGSVVSVDLDPDPAGTDVLTVAVDKANGNGKSFVGTDVEFVISESTAYHGAALSAADLEPGDPVKVKARKLDPDGFGAQKVKEKTL